MEDIERIRLEGTCDKGCEYYSTEMGSDVYCIFDKVWGRQGKFCWFRYMMKGEDMKEQERRTEEVEARGLLPEMFR